jgi:signal transduction histidine kinase
MKRDHGPRTAGPKLWGSGSRGTLTQMRGTDVIESEMLRLSARVEELERERDVLELERESFEHERRQFKNSAAMAAHELLKPLVMAEACAEMIAERAGHTLDLDSRHDLDMLARMSSRVRLLVEALLMDARGDGRPLVRESVDLTEVIGDCVAMLDTELRARDARVDVDPMPVVSGDPALLSGVFGNLLSNAIKHGPRAGGKIHVSATRSKAGWTFAVEGPGPAIPEDDRHRIFEPWHLGRGERRARGVGLGLAIVRRIVERHGGKVGVSTPAAETGNKFFFTLPA